MKVEYPEKIEFTSYATLYGRIVYYYLGHSVYCYSQEEVSPCPLARFKLKSWKH